MCLFRVLRSYARDLTSDLVSRASAWGAFHNYVLFSGERRWAYFFQSAQPKERSSFVRSFRVVGSCLVITSCFCIHDAWFFRYIRWIMNREIMVVWGWCFRFVVVMGLLLGRIALFFLLDSLVRQLGRSPFSILPACY